jgi:hypothetical protein
MTFVLRYLQSSAAVAALAEETYSDGAATRRYLGISLVQVNVAAVRAQQSIAIAAIGAVLLVRLGLGVKVEKVGLLFWGQLIMFRHCLAPMS